MFLEWDFEWALAIQTVEEKYILKSCSRTSVSTQQKYYVLCDYCISSCLLRWHRHTSSEQLLLHFFFDSSASKMLNQRWKMYFFWCLCGTNHIEHNLIWNWREMKQQLQQWELLDPFRVYLEAIEMWSNIKGRNEEKTMLKENKSQTHTKWEKSRTEKQTRNCILWIIGKIGLFKKKYMKIVV